MTATPAAFGHGHDGTPDGVGPTDSARRARLRRNTTLAAYALQNSWESGNLQRWGIDVRSSRQVHEPWPLRHLHDTWPLQATCFMELAVALLPDPENPMTAMDAVDRVVHRAVILELVRNTRPREEAQAAVSSALVTGPLHALTNA
jgi:hypothetical protein